MRSMTTTTLEATSAPVPFAIRVLRRCNPAIVALLRSRLHGLLSRDLLVLGWRGRRTGRAYTLPLSYAEQDGRLYLCTRDSRWVRNLAGGAPVDLVLRGARLRGTPRVLPSADPEALAGLRAFVTKHPRTGETLYAVRRGPDGPRADDLAREVHRSVVVRVDDLRGS